MFEKIFSAIRDFYKTKEQIALHAPILDDNDRKGVLEAIDSGFVSSVGPHVTKFENELAAFTGAKKSIAVVNGTSALHLALRLSNVNKGDLVITQALTFIATPNAIKYCGADPIFLDSDMDTLGLSPMALEKFLNENAEIRTGKCFHRQSSRQISACVPMHVFGHPVRIDEILKICNLWNISVIEDAAGALGSFIGNRHMGTIASIGVLSFNGNKVITTGGGGALLFNDEGLAAKAKHLSTTAKKPHAWEFHHDEIGYNYRMPNLNAALGCAQLARLPKFLQVKYNLNHFYKELFKDLKGFEYFEGRKETSPNYWLNTVLMDSKQQRDELLAAANSVGIGCRPVWELMPSLPIYSNCMHDDLKNAKELSNRIVNLPSGVPS